MANRELTTAAQCFGIGFVAGLRSMTAPAAMANYLIERDDQQELPAELQQLARPEYLNVVRIAAIGECATEKLPFVPARTQQPGLAFRCSSGAACGAVMAISKSWSPLWGGLLGFVGAYAASYIGFSARTWLSENLKISSALLGIPEDFIAVALGVAVTAG